MYSSHVLASKDLEVFVLWAAPLETKNDTCMITRLIVPQQDAHVGLDGAYVHIAGDELSKIAFDNFTQNERNVVQIHTHPSSNVRMSNLDKKWEVVSHVGALSIIVPYYGRAGLEGFPGVNIYEREEDGWRLWGVNEFEDRFKIV